jgi:hypothetical protein
VTLEAAVAAVLEDLGFARHLPGKHNQDNHGDGGMSDALNLAGRLKLGAGQRLTGSGSLKVGSDDDHTLTHAVIDGPDGRRVRLGVVGQGDEADWEAGPDDSADLDAASARQVHTDVGKAQVQANARAREADKAWDAGTPTDPVLTGKAAVAEGRAGDLTWSVYLTDDEPVSWSTSVGIGDEDPLRLDPKSAKKFLAHLDGLAGGTDRAGRYAPEQPRVPAGAAGGGQFGAAGQAKEEPKAKKSGSMGYNPKTGKGTGYGKPDPQVKAFQQLANALGMTDAAGKPLRVDGEFGPKTTAAAKKLQTALGLTPNGRITPALLKKLAGAKSLDEAKAALAPKKKTPRTPAKNPRGWDPGDEDDELEDLDEEDDGGS